MEIPIQDTDEVFVWNVWVSVSEENFERMMELWNTEGRETENPYFGWLSTELPMYPSTLNMRTSIITQPVGQIPLVILELTDHPLSLEQRHGITEKRIEDMLTSFCINK